MIWISPKDKTLFDKGQLQFYVKNDNEWSKDKDNEKIDNSIEKVSVKQLNLFRMVSKSNYMSRI